MAAKHSSVRWRLAMGGVVAVALIVISTCARVFEPWEMWWFDQVLRWRLDLGLTRPVVPRIALLELGVNDENPDTQSAYDDAAAIIEEAANCGVAVVALDFVYQRGSEQTARKLRKAITEADEEYECSVVLGEVLGGGWRRSFPFADRYQPAGFIDVAEDSDGVFRHYQMAFLRGTDLEPSFALGVYLAWLRIDWLHNIQFDKIGEVRWSEGDVGAQSASEAPVLLNFRAPWSYYGPMTFRHYTREELRKMARDLDPQGRKPLQGDILLVAQVEAGDIGATPLGVRQPKILLHATALNDLLQNASLRRFPWFADALLLLASMVLATLAFRKKWSPWIEVAVWLGGCAVLLTLGFIAIVKFLWVPGTVLACLGWSTMCGLLGIQRAMPAARRLERLAATHPKFDVFISAANPDYDLAETVHGYLEGSKINAFFCERSLLQIGNSNFSKVIDSALEQAQHMVVVATDARHLRRSWVEAEWRFFHDELRAGRKEGNLVIVAGGRVSPGELPPSLRGYEMLSSRNGLEPLLAYVRPVDAAESDASPESENQKPMSPTPHD